MSLLWKPLDISLPKGISGFDIVQTEVHSLKLINIAPDYALNIGTTLVNLEPEADSHLLGQDQAIGLGSNTSLPGTSNPTASISTDSSYTWRLDNKIALAALYRLSGALVIRFFHRTGSIKKKNTTWGIGLLRQVDVPDGETCTVGVPVFATGDMSQAMSWAFSQGEARERAKENEVGTVVMTIFIRPGIGKVRRRGLPFSDPATSLALTISLSFAGSSSVA